VISKLLVPYKECYPISNRMEKCLWWNNKQLLKYAKEVWWKTLSQTFAKKISIGKK
jgi:hypothetical protein